MSTQDQLRAIVRTIVPMLVGVIVAQLVDLGMPEETATGLIGAAYYVVALTLQRFLPNSLAQFMLVVPGRPTYLPAPGKSGGGGES